MRCFIKILLLPFYLVYAMCVLIFEAVKGIFSAIFKSIDDSNKKTFMLTPSVPSIVANGHEYEYFVAEYLRRAGYNQVTVTKGSGDYGVDILATKNGIRYAVQCKYYSSPVSLKSVQEVVAGAPCYGCDAAMVVTNNTFTKSAIKLAAANRVTLLSYVNSLPPNNYPQNPVIIEDQKPKRNNKKKWIIITIAYIAAILFSIALFGENALKYIRFDTIVLAILIIIDLIKYRKYKKTKEQNNNEYYYVPENNSVQTITPDTQNNNNEITETESNKSNQ